MCTGPVQDLNLLNLFHKHLHVKHVTWLSASPGSLKILRIEWKREEVAALLVVFVMSGRHMSGLYVSCSDLFVSPSVLPNCETNIAWHMTSKVWSALPGGTDYWSVFLCWGSLSTQASFVFRLLIFNNHKEHILIQIWVSLQSWNQDTGTQPWAADEPYGTVRKTASVSQTNGKQHLFQSAPPE